MENKEYFLRKLKKIQDSLCDKILPNSYHTPLTIEAFHKLYERYRLSDFITYRYVDEGGIWLADNPYGMDSYLAAFEISPLIIAGDRAASHLESVLSCLPAGAVIHSIAHVSADIRGYLEHWAMARRASGNPIYDTITKRRAQYLVDWSLGERQYIHGEQFRPRRIKYYFFIRFPSRYQEVSVEHCHKFVSDVETYLNKISSMMKAAGFGIHRLTGGDAAKTIRLLANLLHDSSKEKKMDATESMIGLEKKIADIQNKQSKLFEKNRKLYLSSKVLYEKQLTLFNRQESLIQKQAGFSEEQGNISKQQNEILEAHTACLIKQRTELEDILKKTEKLLTTTVLESEKILEKQNGNMQKQNKIIEQQADIYKEAQLLNEEVSETGKAIEQIDSERITNEKIIADLNEQVNKIAEDLKKDLNEIYQEKQQQEEQQTTSTLQSPWPS